MSINPIIIAAAHCWADELFLKANAIRGAIADLRPGTPDDQPDPPAKARKARKPAKRTLSPEARERIAAAQRKRWAAARKEKAA